MWLGCGMIIEVSYFNWQTFPGKYLWNAGKITLVKNIEFLISQSAKRKNCQKIFFLSFFRQQINCSTSLRLQGWSVINYIIPLSYFVTPDTFPWDTCNVCHGNWAAKAVNYVYILWNDMEWKMRHLRNSQKVSLECCVWFVIFWKVCSKVLLNNFHHFNWILHREHKDNKQKLKRLKN